MALVYLSQSEARSGSRSASRPGIDVDCTHSLTVPRSLPLPPVGCEALAALESSPVLRRWHRRHKLSTRPSKVTMWSALGRPPSAPSADRTASI
jgi:hypothetical protein